jgi:hypothetical protein
MMHTQTKKIFLCFVGIIIGEDTLSMADITVSAAMTETKRE